MNKNLKNKLSILIGLSKYSIKYVDSENWSHPILLSRKRLDNLNDGSIEKIRLYDTKDTLIEEVINV